MNDPFSTLSHLAGALLFAVLGVELVRRGCSRGAKWGLGIFAGSAVTLLLASALFHAMPSETVARTVTQRLDHAAIFLLIAGTFTPIHAILFRGVLRWGVLAFIWTFAVVGITLKSVFFTSMPDWLGITIYLVMGWAGIIGISVAWWRYGTRYVSPIVWGALAYTVGALCEFTGEPVIWPGVIESHEVFHVAVLVGLGSMWAFVRRAAVGIPGEKMPLRGGSALANSRQRRTGAEVEVKGGAEAVSASR